MIVTLYLTDEIVHMLQLARPKLIICDFNIVGTVQGALQQLQMDRSILTFDGNAEGVQNIETLFDETDVESFEYETYKLGTNSLVTNLL